MKYLLRILSICFIFFLLTPDHSSYPQPVKTEFSDGNVNRYVLPNGMTVLLKEDHKNPVAAVEVWVNTGSVTEGRFAASGISHFVEHMIFKGTPKRKVGDIAKEIQNYGGEINAHTSYESTVYTVNIDSRYFLNACEILGDCVTHPLFDKDELEKERSVILKEINMTDDDPDRRAYKTFFGTAFTTHPFKDPLIGYENIFKKITRDDLVGYYNERYLPENIVFVAVGDFDQKAAYERLKEIFKDFNRKSLKPVYVPAEPRQLGYRTFVEKGPVNKAFLFAGFHTTDVRDDDKFALDVMSMILGEGRSSRLYRILRDKLSLVNGVGSWSFTPSYPGLFVVNATLDPKNLDAVRSEVLKEIYRLKTEPVSDEELEKVKQVIASDHYFSLETVIEQASDLGSGEVSAGNFNYSKDYLEKVNKVTKEDILKAANKYFYDDNLTVTALVPQDFPISETAKGAGKETAGEIQKFELPNGIRLLVREDHTLPTLNIKAVMKGGLIVENEQNNGISNLCAQLLLKGTKTRTAEEIAREIESVGGSISSYSANNSFGCSVDILAAKKDIAFDIFADVMLNPVFKEEYVEKEKRVVRLNIKAIEDQPFQAAAKLFKETMFKGHPYRFEPVGSEKSVENITREAIADFYKKYSVPENMVIAVFGDIKAGEIKEEIEKRFGRLKNTGLTFPRTSFEFKKEVVRENKKNKGKQAIVVIGFHAVDIYNPDKYPLEIMDAMFSGQSSRLFASIRDEEGLAYAVGASMITGFDTGAFLFLIGTVPEKADYVIKRVLQKIEEFKAGGVDDEELTRAKNGLIGARKILLQSSSHLALQASLDELYGLGYDNYKLYYDRINKNSKSDINKMAEKYFVTDDYVVVVVGPEDDTVSKSETAGKTRK